MQVLTSTPNGTIFGERRTVEGGDSFRTVHSSASAVYGRVTVKKRSLLCCKCRLHNVNGTCIQNSNRGDKDDDNLGGTRLQRRETCSVRIVQWIKQTPCALSRSANSFDRDRV